MIKAPTAQEFCNITMLVQRCFKGYWSGSAFRYHPRGVFRERMLFVNKWNTNNYCEVRVFTDPNAELVLGCQDPCAHGDPVARPSKGEAVTVYRNGSWVSDGPWCEKIVRILNDLKREAEAFRKAEREEWERKQTASREAARRSLEAAAAALT